ncbi:hypothetical protein CBR_g18782 [Chara braunii]|uniref:Uncharacterized protein n=1 Tax=Chara braunii TaxID=69332 RepID=A0A388KWG0_CHABU|nr:hypothetical protein CBR_g18782 [Chara braunii]|eukprot:GBG74371.1 hypothetical protein CBR_g18782 [Chara braunii]
MEENPSDEDDALAVEEIADGGGGGGSMGGEVEELGGGHHVAGGEECTRAGVTGGGTTAGTPASSHTVRQRGRTPVQARQTSIVSYAKNPRQQEIDDSCCEFFVENAISFNAAKSKSFKKFTLACYGPQPSVKHPLVPTGYNLLRCRLLDRLHGRLKDEDEAIRAEWEVGCGFALPWTANESLLDVEGGIWMQASWEQTDEGMGQEEHERQARSWRRDPCGSKPPPGGVANIFCTLAEMLRPYPRDDNNDFFEGQAEERHRAGPFGEPWLAFFAGGDRLQALRNNANGRYCLQVGVDLTGGNRSPIVTQIPILPVPRLDNVHEHHDLSSTGYDDFSPDGPYLLSKIYIGAMDEDMNDNQALTFRVGNEREYGGLYNYTNGKVVATHGPLPTCC